MNSVTINPITKVAPANAETFSIVDDTHPAIYGYIVSTEYTNNPNDANESSANEYKRPLFIPSTQDKEKNIDFANASNAYLRPLVSGGTIYDAVKNQTGYDQYEYFVLTNKYYYINDGDNVKTAEVPGFYRLENINNESLKTHRAYLVLTKSESGTASNNVKFIPLFDFDGELVDAIDEVPAEVTESVIIDLNGTFYTLQGLKIEGYPKKSGIYMQNGKKVLVK